ncbi:1-deoxy-D-xylulose-5-phosphate synthase [Inmirania thermothiophila]|uniref:1-deoxy-D-xylulose-5-phosphate synthase n=1 Tax=Inmirania thermothiophila TaxID=1750597 RepID=A0A3N1Y542_9GAMM|nr:1-deoxy-D-xylulose-5-phosphate synthase [Inmirania thermothiophila]ROR32397.1 1-deoxy-D-xylulose-5-phosphate synthase [Inmirania thermothiophila]
MGEDARYRLLSMIDSPADLRRLPRSRLPAVADEVRRCVIETVAAAGGHFAANLGAVELAVALHYVYRTPHDLVVWDVGHQAYPHKILTGRREALRRVRRRGGPSGFPRREESPYDAFGVGHASTAIGAGLGMAVGAALRGEDRRVVAVIGDGGLTGGMAYEALNHAGHLGADLLVVLNDNEMSISPNVGALSRSLARLWASPLYGAVRAGGERALARMGPAGTLLREARRQVKGLLGPAAFFQELGFDYHGPVDGHDVETLVAVLARLRERRGPQLLHVVTRKGKGYPPAEADPVAWHATGPFDPAAGRAVSGAGGATWTEVFGAWICEAAAREPRLVAITPAMREGSGLVAFAERFPQRYFDVGIAEQHAVTFAAGLACAGLRPVVAIYSTFLQRAYDQLIHDVALQGLPVLFAIDRAGVVGPDGPTHAGAFDLTYLRCIPGLTVMAPADAAECRAMLEHALALEGPAAVRWPRGPAPAGREAAPLAHGRGVVVRRGGSGVALLVFGALLEAALAAAEALDATVAGMRFVKPLDETLLRELAATHRVLVTLEDNVVAGGAGGAVAEALAGAGPRLLHLGLPDRFQGHGSRGELLAEAGLDAEGIVRAVRRAAGGVRRRPALRGLR